MSTYTVLKFIMGSRDFQKFSARTTILKKQWMNELPDTHIETQTTDKTYFMIFLLCLDSNNNTTINTRLSQIY